MRNEDIINGLYEASEWISAMIGGDLGAIENDHIRYMLKAIDEAIDNIRFNQ